MYTYTLYNIFRAWYNGQTHQGCALEMLRCHRQLTFAFEQLEELACTFFVLGTQDFMVKGLLAPCKFP